MNCDTFTLDFLLEAFPKIDVRVIKATVLEHGDDIDTALNFLKSVMEDEFDEGRNDSLYGEGSDSVKASTITPNNKNALPEQESARAAQELSSSDSPVCLASLQEIVEEARNHKESVINLVKVISDLRAKADQEKTAAVEANIQAANSGEDLLRKAEELHKRILEKKQLNLSRVGEIYGEKAVLATEARGLKQRLEQVKLQKEKALTTLNEIKVRLQSYYDDAVRDRMEAENRRKERENFAVQTLVAEEEVMALVDEESKKLDMEAEVCSQLKEFLSHHGAIIDSLQGEMCVLCEDVESYKRQVDDNLWSSSSTASLPVYVNPEGPYTFRKCSSISSASSSQELSQSFETLGSSKKVSSRVSGSTSLCADEPVSGSSHGGDTELPQRLASLGASCSDLCEAASRSDFIEAGNMNGKMDRSWHQSFESSASHISDGWDSDMAELMAYEWHESLKRKSGRNDMSSNQDGAAGRVYQVMDSVLPSTRMRNGASSRFGIDLNASAVSSTMEGIDLNASALSSSTMAGAGFEFTDSFSGTVEVADPSYSDHLSSLRSCDDWVLTREQMEASGSSTSSSLIKVEADDYRTD